VIRLKLLGGPRAGQVLPFGTEPLRIGRGASAQLRFDDAAYGMVSTHHAQIVFERGGFQLIDTGSRNGTFVNGRRLSDRHRLVHGDRLCFGHPGGPEVEVELDEAALAPTAAFHIDPAAERTLVLEPRPGATASPSPAPAYDAHADAERLAQHLRDGLQGGLHDTAAHEVVREAAQQVAERRARAGGQRSGDTVMLLAQAMHKASARVEHRTRSRWQKLLAGVGGAALLVIAVLAVICHRPSAPAGLRTFGSKADSTQAMCAISSGRPSAANSFWIIGQYRCRRSSMARSVPPLVISRMWCCSRSRKMGGTA
jgi:hypothetical protein